MKGCIGLHLECRTRAKANAALAGLGRTRRVYLGDTLLDNFPQEEIEVVFAHEIGHHVHRHLPKLVVDERAAGGLAGFWLVDLIVNTVRRLSGSIHPSPGPVGGCRWSWWCCPLFGLAASPLQHAISRHFERQSDRYALERTQQPDAYQGGVHQAGAC